MRAFIVAAFCSTALLQAQSQQGTPFRIETLGPGLDAIVDANAQLEMLGDRFALTEGPVWMPDAAGVYGEQLQNPHSVVKLNNRNTVRPDLDRLNRVGDIVRKSIDWDRTASGEQLADIRTRNASQPFNRFVACHLESLCASLPLATKKLLHLGSFQVFRPLGLRSPPTCARRA
jgi:hypothetical protein